MKAVMTDIPPEVLKWRKRTGLDQLDEMWEGKLGIHMAGDEATYAELPDR